MGSCYSDDHIAEDHNYTNVHMDITTFNIAELQQKYYLGTVSNRLLGGLTGCTEAKP